MVRFAPPLLAGLFTLLPSCLGTDAPQTAMRVEWGLTDPAAMLPADVDFIRIVIESEGMEARDPSFTVSLLEDADGNGRNELDIGDIPPGVPTRITVEGSAAAGVPAAYVGRAGPFVLQHGERRFIDIRMYPIGDVASLDSTALSPRFLHTATTLADGRVLIAGGFDRLIPTPCPAGTMDPDGRCFAATATASAAIFEPATGRVRATRESLLEARGGQTATLLPSGAVLLAGGTENATLVFEHQEGGFSFRVVPGVGGDTFELFDPERNAEEEDLDRDGDPARGGFVGAAEEPEVAGRLDAVRMLHAATPLEGGRVLLAGGVGALDSFTVFDPDRAGGYGVVGNGRLGTDRAMPGAVTLGTGAMQRGWIIGGASAESNADLADVWRAGMGADRLGTTVPATMAGGMFPDTMSSMRPELALFRPLTALLGGGSHAVVVGWFGPRCSGGMPAFSPGAAFCPYTPSNLRSFTINAMTGVATPTMVTNAHAFGAITTMDDGRVAVSGGFLNLAFQAGNTIDVFSGAVGASGIATIDAARPPMRLPRAFHTTVAVPRRGLVTFGGIVAGADLVSATLVGGLEVVFLPCMSGAMPCQP